MLDSSHKQYLTEMANLIRGDILTMIAAAGSGHPGGSLSAADIITCLYFAELNIDPQEPAQPDRDRLILSKGHAAPVLYAALARRGFFPVEWLSGLRQLGSPLQGHPDMHKVPGVEASTGSLGQGLAWGIGMALAGRMDARDYATFVILGDGELQEGMIWESAMAAAQYKLDRLVAIVDYNGLQIDGPLADVMSPEPIDAKFAAFGWNVLSIDGHDLGQILQALQATRLHRGGPTAIIAHTIKGKGFSFMENKAEWHGTAPNQEQVGRALSELQ